MDPSEFAARRKRLHEVMRERKLDGFVVTSLVNVRYLSGFTGSNGVLLLGGGAPLLFTDPRYEIQSARQSDCRVRVARGPLVRAVGASLRRRRWKRIGFENGRIGLEVYRELERGLAPGAALVEAGDAIERLRMIKSAAEIALIRASVKLCSKAYERALRRLRPGLTERALAARLEFEMGRLGAEKPAFETIVAVGEHTALPHAEPAAGTIGSNELLLIDMGAQLQGYASDMTRMAHLGKPARKIRQLHGAVLEAQLAAIEKIRPGVTSDAVDQEARRVLGRHGLDELFTHSTGHGLGLEIHEAPRIGRGDQTRLEAGMVITVEPGVYMEGFGGIRIEDTVLVTARGHEVLTPTPKELRVV